MNPHIYIVILNWNGWRDTIECLESVFRLKYPLFKVVVCDNASSDQSWEEIKAWAEGRRRASSENPALSHFIEPPVPKPVEYVTYSSPPAGDALLPNPPLVLIQTGKNLGFAGGNNVGLRYALSKPDCDYVWMLNNDTVVDPAALAHLVQRMQERPTAGLGGSTLLYYNEPSKIQALGGSVYNRWFARGGHIGQCHDASQIPRPEEIEKCMAYVVGASMLVSRPFLDGVGPLNEDYFLFFEEIDWATRAKGKFDLTYSAASLVFHREGASIGSGKSSLDQSELSEYYATRNRIIFTRRYYPYALITLYPALVASLMHRMVNRKWRNAVSVLRGLLGGTKRIVWRTRQSAQFNSPVASSMLVPHDK